ncbi:MAG: hypothetical protein ACYC56_14390, partial [Candidatus Aquicultor sp.]
NLFSQQAPFISEDIAFKGDVGSAVGGVPVAVAKDAVKAFSELDPMNIAPTGIRNIRKANEMEKKGVKWGAKTLIPSKEEFDENPGKYKDYVTPTDVTAKKLGFTTSKISDAYESEQNRAFKSTQMGDLVKKKVENKIVPLIQKGDSEAARAELQALYDRVMASDMLTDSQRKSIHGLSSFTTQYVLPKIKNEDTYDVVKEFQGGVFGKRIIVF